MKQFLFILFFIFSLITCHSQVIDSDWIGKNYTKKEVMIPMRDGVRLYTAIYEPVSKLEKHPILLTRTPYKVGSYGTKMSSDLWNIWRNYSREGYIFVIQDVRGRWMSEGQFVNIRPFNPDKKTVQDIDEASDSYDTVEWLLENTDNNGRVGVTGSSYLGFYSVMAALSNHPAICAICAQAPAIDWFMGDDIHHNGAFMLEDSFRFLSSLDRPRATLTTTQPQAKSYYLNDDYSFFLKSGSVKQITSLLGDSIKFWNDVMAHPNYDSWWRERDCRRYCYNLKPAVFVVGGLFDAEDLYGTLGLYKAIKKQSPRTNLSMIIGPWSHGQWKSKEANSVGNIVFGKGLAEFYQNEAEFSFFNYYLKEKGNVDYQNRVLVFFSGENQWRKFTEWPCKQVVETPVYLREEGTLKFTQPTEKKSYTEYISDPLHPVPYSEKASRSRGSDYMTADQRFASRRPDVISFETEPLAADLTLGGEITVDLKVSISTTDADFVVKLIDEFPVDFSSDPKNIGEKQNILMDGYQMLIRGDVMRGKFRDSFERPKAFTPNTPVDVSFKLADIAHTFKKGHRMIVQIQSSWFPLVDRNPQKFVDIYHCKNSDFVKSKIKVFHQNNLASRLILPVLK